MTTWRLLISLVFLVSAAPAAAQDAPRQGGILKAAIIGEPPTLDTHTTTATIAARLPAWFREQIAAPSFVVLPLMVKGAPFALIYADKAELGAVRFTPQELALLGTLRNQAVMAFRQASG